MKKVLKVNILKSGMLNDELLRIITGNNEGVQSVSLEDIESFVRCKKAMAFFAYDKAQTGRHENLLEITEDNGKSFTLQISEVEVDELVIDNDNL